ncbi:MAG TPA: hypothetical protein VGJ91_14820 [Polyangiaceae bacterium]
MLAGISASSAARAADPGTRPIAVALHSESSELTLDALEHALTEELEMPTVAADSQASAAARGVLTVTYRPLTKELVVSYSEAARGTLTRVVPAPERVTEVPGFAALVAGNLVRDQATELLHTEPATAIAPIPLAQAEAPAPAPAVEAASTEVPSPVHWRANASLFYPLATNADLPELSTNFDLNLLYGHIGALNGLELGTVSTVSGDAQGLQASVLTNLVGGQVRAAQFSLLYNRGRSVEGIQVALLNRSDEAMQGFQLGALNLAGSLSKGVQLSGLNSAGNFQGVQIGLVNLGKRVSGAQIGLINIADDVDGVPIGLISVSKTGGVHPVAWSSNTTYANLGVKFGTRYTYTMISGAMHSDGRHGLYGGGFTIGGSIPVAKRLTTEIDLQALHLFADAGCTWQAPAQSSYPAIEGASDQGSCVEHPTTTMPNNGYTIPGSGKGFTSATSRAYDQSLAKLRAMLRFELLSRLSLFVGTGVTGQVTYPVVGGDTQVKLRLLSEFFGGVQL